MKKQTEKNRSILKQAPKIQNLTIKEVQNVFNETTQTTVIELQFDDTVVYMGIAEAYKFQKQLKTILGLE